MIEQFATGAHPPLVGRQRETDALWKRFEAAATGQTGVVLIAGEPGIGKSRLLDTFAARVTSTGAHVLRGGASEAAGMPPYLPFLEALGQYVRATPPDELRVQAGDMAGILRGAGLSRSCQRVWETCHAVIRSRRSRRDFGSMKR